MEGSYPRKDKDAISQCFGNIVSGALRGATSDRSHELPLALLSKTDNPLTRLLLLGRNGGGCEIAEAREGKSDHCAVEEREHYIGDI